MRIVIKVGTRILTDKKGNLNLDYIKNLVKEMSDLKKEGNEVLLVSSGAIGIGVGKLNLNKKPRNLIKKQAIAAIGQSQLIQFYEKLFFQHNLTVAQILLTREDLKERKRYLNSRNTLLEVLKYGAIPIINENDTVATEEIEFGDNDILSALVASLISADFLIILSTVDGLYSKDPKKQKNNEKIEFINFIYEITDKLLKKATNSTDDLGTGGMTTKLEAAKIASDSGVLVAIANGKKNGIIRDIIKKRAICTYIDAKKINLSMRKRWLSYGPSSQGTIVIDSGAEKAIINSGKSLLLPGIFRVEGSFSAGEMVKIENKNNFFIARGLTNYSSVDLDKVKGLQREEIKNILGIEFKTEVIHRNNLVIRLARK